MSKFIAALLTVLFLSGLFVKPALAVQGPWSMADEVRARLLSASRDVGPETASVDLLLEVQMSEGWHSYWRVSGDSGLPPRFDWSGSGNVEKAEIFWPVPRRMAELDFQIFGYKNAVSFPVRLTLKEPGKPVQVALRLDIMVCEHICIPQALDVSLVLEAGEGEESGMKRVVEAAMGKLPVRENTPAIGIETIVAGPEAIAVSAYAADGFEQADLFAAVDGFGFTAPPVIQIDETDPRKAMITLPKPDDIENLTDFLTGKTLSLTLVAGDMAIEKEQGF